jgi:hypothetical protein
MIRKIQWSSETLYVFTAGKNQIQKPPDLWVDVEIT